MKPALLYLRQYIEENYQNKKLNRQDSKQNHGVFVNKCSQEFIFREKKAHQCNNTQTKEFYFKPPKSLNAIRQKQKLYSQTLKIQSKRKNPQATSPSDQTFRVVNQTDYKKGKRTIISSIVQTSKQLNVDENQQDANPDFLAQKQVRFMITTPSGQTPNFGTSPENQSASETPRVSPQFVKVQQLNINQYDMNLIIAQTFGQETPQFVGKSQHFKLASKSMKKIGYNTLFDYLNEMKKYQNTKKKEIKEAYYYPLPCMTPSIDETQQYQLMAKKHKAFLRERLEKFKKEVTIEENFSKKSIELKNLNNNSSFQKKMRSNFSRPGTPNLQKQQHDQTLQKKSKKFLLEYEQIVICNCANKKYLSYKLSENTDYNSFFKFTAPLLDSQPQKENNYLIGNKEAESLGLYFCCLINTSLGVREGFFWIRKPLQYYRKDKVIKIIDNFLFDVDTYNMFETDRLWIVDSHGRNSHILKSMLKKCNEFKNNSELLNSSTSKQKSRTSKRMALSVSQQPNTQTPQIIMSLLANFSQFSETKHFKKQRNNINTRGSFKLMYESTENMG